MHVSFDGFEEEIAEIFRLIIPKGIGSSSTPTGATPRRGRVAAAVPLPGRRDRHPGDGCPHAGFVGCAVRGGQALLRACGFRRFAAFRQKPVWHEL